MNEKNLPIPPSEYRNRIDRCREKASDRGLDGLIVLGKDPDRAGNLIYLANHHPLLSVHPAMYENRGRGFGAVVIPVDKDPILVVTVPYYNRDEVALDDVRVSMNLPRMIGTVVEGLRLDRGRAWGIAGEEFFPITLYRDLEHFLPSVRFVTADDVLWTMRIVKTPFEQEIIHQAAKVSDEGVKAAMNAFHAGSSEIDVTGAVARALLSNGAENLNLSCQSGLRRSGEPMMRPAISNRIIERGDMAHMEIRGTFRGYVFDICRGVVAGSPSAEQQKIIEIVNSMLDASCEAIKPGVRAEEPHLATTKVGKDAGYGAHFSYEDGGPATYTGHGIGVDYDEPPIMGLGDKTILREGMYLTPEPGLFRTKVGGVRLEIGVLVTKSGCERLGSTPLYWSSKD